MPRKNYNLDIPNVIFLPYYEWDHDCAKTLRWFPDIQQREIKYKYSAICNRITQNKKPSPGSHAPVCWSPGEFRRPVNIYSFHICNHVFVEVPYESVFSGVCTMKVLDLFVRLNAG